MTQDEVLSQVRRQIEQRIAATDLVAGDFEGHSLLLRHGHYCGHRFVWKRAQAVWFLEESEIKLADAHGTTVARFHLQPIAPPQPQHAARAA